MKARTFFISLIVFVGISAIAIGVMVYLNSNRSGINVINTTTTPGPTLSDTTSKIVGYIYTSGLSTGPEYQITYLNIAESIVRPEALQNQIEGSFLVGQDADYAQFWGKCVEVTGTMGPDINRQSLPETYYRSYISVTDIKISGSCAVSLNSYPEYEQLTGTYSGRIEKNTRPAPDIGYDYKLILSTPFTTTNTASGLEETVTDIIIVPLTEDTLEQMQDNLNKTVTVDGEWMNGFAETNFFLVNRFK